MRRIVSDRLLIEAAAAYVRDYAALMGMTEAEAHADIVRLLSDPPPRPTSSENT